MSNMAVCTFQPRQLHTPQLLFIGPFGRRLWTKQHSQPGELNNDLGETWRNRRTWTWWQWRDGMEDGWKWLEVIYRSWLVALHANPVLAGHVALFVPHSWRSHGLSMVLPCASPPPKSIFLRQLCARDGTAVYIPFYMQRGFAYLSDFLASCGTRLLNLPLFKKSRSLEIALTKQAKLYGG